MRSVRSFSTTNIKPVFSLGGSVSGYPSMGSADNICAAGRDQLVWRPQVISVDTPEDEEATVSTNKMFKSSFAKELEVKTATQSFIEDKLSENPDLGKCLSCNTSDLGSERRSIVDREEQTLVLTQAVEEFLRVKADNERLKMKMKTCIQGDGRYKKLEIEVDNLNLQLSKVFEAYKKA